MLIGPEITVDDGVINVSNSVLTPELTLIQDEEKDIHNAELWEAIVNAIDGKVADDAPVLKEELCECELTYVLRLKSTYPKGYYLTLHDHGIEISAYCKFRKCMDLYGIVEVDEKAMAEIIGMIAE
jgi:hypothetical protein